MTVRLLLALLVWTAAGCSIDPIELEGRRCPCAAGWLCDPDAGVCRRADAGAPARGTVPVSE